MTTAKHFDTPGPVDLELRLHLAVVDLRTDDDVQRTTVEVAPTDPDDPTDVWAAEHTSVEQHGDRIVVTAPDQREIGDRQSISVTVGLPSGSRLDLDGANVELRAAGRVGRCRIGVAAGSLHLDRLGPSTIELQRGDIEVTTVEGDLELSVSSGSVRVDAVDGDADLGIRSGDLRVGSVAGAVSAEAAAGGLHIGTVGGALRASTASGTIRVDQVGTGVDVTTTSGGIELGVTAEMAALLDLDSRSGRVRSDVASSGEPGPGEPAVRIKAATRSGDITIRHSTT